MEWSGVEWSALVMCNIQNMNIYRDINDGDMGDMI